jgi:hypothetical protein
MAPGYPIRTEVPNRPGVNTIPDKLASQALVKRAILENSHCIQRLSFLFFLFSHYRFSFKDTQSL